jgi:DNA-binding CsgD family transcriptional regulator/PAS domain-containing protein
MGETVLHEERISRAIDACYDASVEPERWPDALHELARSLDSVCAMFYPEIPSGRLLTVPASRDYGDFLEDYVKGGWYENHYRADRGWPQLRGGRPVVIEHDLATDEERKHLRHYNDLYLRWGFPGFAMVGFRIDGESWALPLLRDTSQGHFDREDSKVLAELAPHFRRMIRLSERMARDRATAGLEVLDAMKGAAIFVGRDGHVIAMNKNAERLLGNGLVLHNGHLDTDDGTARAKLYALIASMRIAESVGGRPGDPVVIRRPDMRPLVVEAFPAQSRLSDVFGSLGTLLLVTDLDARCGPTADALRSALGLTPAEARLTARLCEGDDLAAAAYSLGISVHTARTQLKSVFAKTGTSRQAELVALANNVGRLSRSLER